VALPVQGEIMTMCFCYSAINSRLLLLCLSRLCGYFIMIASLYHAFHCLDGATLWSLYKYHDCVILSFPLSGHKHGIHTAMQPFMHTLQCWS
jgi:hypothetical protein